MFGDLQESLLSACREALDTAAQKKDRTIIFWMNGFAAVSSEWRVIIIEMIGASLSEPHTSVTAFAEVVCMSVCLSVRGHIP